MVKKAILLLVVILFVLAGCVTHRHVIGDGAQKGVEVTKAQWYIVWGLIPLGDVDTRDMSAGADDYEIITQYTVIDTILSYLGSFISVSRRTVKVVL